MKGTRVEENQIFEELCRELSFEPNSVNYIRKPNTYARKKSKDLEVIYGDDLFDDNSCQLEEDELNIQEEVQEFQETKPYFFPTFEELYEMECELGYVKDFHQKQIKARGESSKSEQLPTIPTNYTLKQTSGEIPQYDTQGRFRDSTRSGYIPAAQIKAPNFSYYTSSMIPKPKREYFNQNHMTVSGNMKSSEQSILINRLQSVTDCSTNYMYSGNQIVSDVKESICFPPQDLQSNCFKMVYCSVLDNNSSNMVENPLYTREEVQPKLKNRVTSNDDMFKLDDVFENYLNVYSEITPLQHRQLQGFYGRIFTTQHYCKIIQKCLSKTSMNILSSILHEIGGIMGSMMTDQYANYLCPKLYSVLDVKNRLDFLSFINMCDPRVIAKNVHGTYSLQKIIELVNSIQECRTIVNIFNDCIMDLSQNAQSVHVIEKIFATVDAELINNFYIFTLKNFLYLAQSSLGIGIVKMALSNVKNKHIEKAYFNILIENTLGLVQHPFGNYAIQTASEVWGCEFSNCVFEKLVGNLHGFSKLKATSRVLEKCIELGGYNIVSTYIQEIYYSNSIAELMKDSYGNYVVQCVLKHALGQPKQLLLSKMQNEVGLISSNKIRMKWVNIIQCNIDQSTTFSNRIMSATTTPQQPNSRLNLNSTSFIPRFYEYGNIDAPRQAIA